MDYKDFLTSHQISGGLRPGSIRDIYLKEGRLITEPVYGFQEFISPGRDVIFSFYIPENTLKLSFLMLNVYFPGFQIADYPENSPAIYLPAHRKGTPVYKKHHISDPDYTWAEFEQGYFEAGRGADSSWWSYVYRAFLKFYIAPLHGFKLKNCRLEWLLASHGVAGSGSNTQIPILLDAIDDYESLDKNDWGIPTQVEYGVVNEYDDETGVIYSKDVKTRTQTLLDAQANYAAFRFKEQSDPVDIDNANNFRLSEPLLYCELEEDTSEKVGLYHDNGKGFGDRLISFNEDIEELELQNYFSGTGKKRIMISCLKSRRLEILVRMGLKMRS